jgi:hypothetical protein
VGAALCTQLIQKLEARYDEVMKQKICSECGEAFVTDVDRSSRPLNTLTCSPRCALHRKTDLQRSRSGDAFVAARQPGGS